MLSFDSERIEAEGGLSDLGMTLFVPMRSESKDCIWCPLLIAVFNLKLLAVVAPLDVALFGIGILIVFFLLFGIFIFGVWLSRAKGSLSPYSKQPMRKGEELSYESKVKILRFLYEMHQYDNRIFELSSAAVCRETGRIFPNAITWYGVIKLDWTFLKKRYPGNYVSWGSLTTDQQELVRASHASIKGFQIDFSSPFPQPKAIEAKYAFAKPGPLYVDIETKVLLGWQCVPRSEFEVLIVQKPDNLIPLGSSIT